MQPYTNPFIHSKDFRHLQAIAPTPNEVQEKVIDGRRCVIQISSPPISNTPFHEVFDEADQARMGAGKTGACFLQLLPHLQQGESSPFVKMLVGLAETGFKETAIAHVAKSSTRSVRQITVITDEGGSHSFTMLDKSKKWRIYSQDAAAVAEEEEQQVAIAQTVQKCHELTVAHLLSEPSTSSSGSF